jgi:hypothetical protein
VSHQTQAVAGLGEWRFVYKESPSPIIMLKDEGLSNCGIRVQDRSIASVFTLTLVFVLRLTYHS